jgi:hypothetical protein
VISGGIIRNALWAGVRDFRTRFWWFGLDDSEVLLCEVLRQSWRIYSYCIGGGESHPETIWIAVGLHGVRCRRVLVLLILMEPFYQW